MKRSKFKLLGLLAIGILFGCAMPALAQDGYWVKYVDPATGQYGRCFQPFDGRNCIDESVYAPRRGSVVTNQRYRRYRDFEEYESPRYRTRDYRDYEGEEPYYERRRRSSYDHDFGFNSGSWRSGIYYRFRFRKERESFETNSGYYGRGRYGRQRNYYRYSPNRHRTYYPY